MTTFWTMSELWCLLVSSARASHLGQKGANAGGVFKVRCRAMFLRSGCILAVLQLLPLCAAIAVGAVGEEGELAAAASSNLYQSAGGMDPDESPEGRQRIQEIENRASQLSKERDGVAKERRPFALRRDAMLGETALARERAARNQVAVIATGRQIAQLENQIKWLTGSEEKAMRTQQNRLRASLNTLSRRVDTDQKLMGDRMAQIGALNSQIGSLDRRLLRLEEELSESRKQWLRIRQPLVKYSRGDFEGLRRVLDDWLVMDGQWPEAFAWAALCAFELNEIGSASAYLDKAQRLRRDLTGSKKLWPQLEALTALIRAKQLGQSVKAEAALANALRLANKNSDWETYFLVGRYYFEQPAEGFRAKTNFQRALAIQPNCDCAQVWLARLQTTSTLTDVRDLKSGTTCLEQFWEKCGQKSWRLACFLAEAYSASQRTKDAEKMWSRAAELAPVEHKQRVVQNANSTIK